VNVDFNPHKIAKTNILLDQTLTPAQNNQNTINSIKSLSVKFNAILVTAGGWTGGSIADADYVEKVKLMNKVNLYPAMLAAHLSTKYLAPNGLVVFTGAAAVYKEPQPDMIAYALAKAGTHYLASHLAERV